MNTACATCATASARCEAECMAEAACRDIDYFDDEELDRFRQRPGNSYSADEVEEFAYVLETMRTDEVAAWLRSLALRGVELPDQLKDEAYACAAESPAAQ